jgi:hypothetical protein
MIRTFHPVGQGAFYTERFYDDKGSVIHTIVFDCGVLNGPSTRSKKYVQHAFEGNDNIDYLFISHLDKDHISLVETLLSTCYVRQIVLPLMSEEDLVIALALQQIAGNNTSVSFIQRLITHIRRDHDNDYKRGDYMVRFVGSTESSWTGGNTIWPNGKQEALWDIPDWVLIPYNVESKSRKEALKKQLGLLLKQDDIGQEIQALGETITDGDSFFEALKKASFVGRVIANDGELLKGLKSVYNKVGGTINDNSIQLYSGPMIGKNWDMIFERYRCFHCWNDWRVGCLYTGDCQFDISTWKDRKFSQVWGNVGTIQLPHHGSIDSFDISNNPIDKPYLIVASCGNTNTYGHPSEKLLEYLLLNKCIYRIVTESLDSIYMQRMVH